MEITLEHPRSASGRPYSRADIREKLNVTDDTLQALIEAKVFPRPDYSALFMASRWRRPTLAAWRASGGRQRVTLWLARRA